jgi:hypothetical protein
MELQVCRATEILRRTAAYAAALHLRGEPLAGTGACPPRSFLHSRHLHSGKFMAYRFESDFATVQDGVRKIAIELIDDAIGTANHRGRDFHETVHSLRKACKKLRGLIRVVRPVFDDYRTENAVFRDAGRHFSFLRDGGVMIETYDGLLEEYKDQVDRSKFAHIRRRFTVLQKEMETPGGLRYDNR